MNAKNKHAKNVKQTLMSLIGGMSKNMERFVKNPGKDFTRNRKLPFETVVKLLISIGGNSICKELLEAQDYASNIATTSAFVQQRDKIKPFAFEFLFHKFTQTHKTLQKHQGYRIYAVDGSDLLIATNADDSDTYIQSNPNGHGHNRLHLNAMYDLCNKIYVDSYVQPVRHKNEKHALTDMVDRSSIEDKVIVIADRNYESYNIFAHIERKGWNYVIRVKDLDSNGILSGLNLPADDEFDICINRILTKKQTKEIRTNPNVYRCLAHNSTFDFLDKHENQFYTMSFRIVRIRISDDCYETIITNLDTKDFSSNEIKELYKMRWGIETSFRELKYSVGLTHFHAKKQEYIVQEIFARLIMYNFSEIIISHIIIYKSDTKHYYQVNFTIAVHICRRFLRPPRNALPLDIEALIRKNVLPVRAGRRAKRVVRSKSAVSFIYRIA